MERRKIISVAVFSAAIAGGGVAGVILGTPASGSAAASSPTTSVAKPHRFGFGRGMGDGAVLDAAAKAIGVSTDTLLTDMRNGQTIAQVAKSKNVSTQTVIDAMVAAAKQQLANEESNLESQITNEVNGKFERPMGHAGPGGPSRGFGFRGGFGLDAAAKAIGVSEQTLLNDVKNGQTIAQVAKSRNVSTQTVIAAMVASAKSQLDAQVKAGHLSGDMEKKIESGLTQMITNQVNGTFAKPSFPGAAGSGWRGGAGGFGGGPGRGGPGMYGPGGGSGSGASTTSGGPTV